MLAVAQSDIANPAAEEIDWQTRAMSFSRSKTGTVSIIRFGGELERILRSLPQGAAKRLHGNVFSPALEGPSRMLPMFRMLMGLAGGVPIVVLGVAVFAQRLFRRRRGDRAPTEERLLRPPGYSLGRQIETISERYTDLLLAAFLCAMVAVGAFVASPKGSGDEWVFLVFFGLASAVCTAFAWRKLQELRGKKLGLLGEQTIGDLLGRLARMGYRVFHDVPGTAKWNVDHVVVGPGGIFAIETKCRSKRPSKGGRPASEAIFDGEAIRFPRYSDLEAPAQARRNAEWVAKEMSKAVCKEVEARAIVALPGWYVPNPRKEWEVWVLSGKMVPSWIEQEPRRLSEELINRVAYQLDRRCRDVEM